MSLEALSAAVSESRLGSCSWPSDSGVGTSECVRAPGFLCVTHLALSLELSSRPGRGCTVESQESRGCTLEGQDGN